MDAKDVGIAKRKFVFDQIKEQEDIMMEGEIANSLERGRLAFGSRSISYAGMKNKTMDITNRVQRMKSNLNSAMDMARHIGQGIFQK